MTKGKIVYYTVYLAKNDKIVAFGTPAECAEMLGMTKNTFLSTMSHTKRGRLTKYEVYKELVDEAEYRGFKRAAHSPQNT